MKIVFEENKIQIFSERELVKEANKIIVTNRKEIPL